MNEKLLQPIDETIDSALITIKSFTENEIERISLQCEYAKEEIQIRIESLKTELDNLNDKYVVEVDAVKKDVINTLKGRVEENKLMIENLKSIVKTDKEKDNSYEERFDELTIDKILEEMKSWNFQLKFVPKKEIVTESFLGILSYNTNYKQMFERTDMELSKSNLVRKKDNLYEHTNQQMASNYENVSLKDLREIETERIDLQFEYVKDELHIKIDSLKKDLDKVRDKYDDNLNILRNDIMQVVNCRAEENEVLDDLKKKRDNQNDILGEESSEYQNKMKSWNFQIQFIPSKQQIIDEKLVGMLSYNTSYKQILETKKTALGLGNSISLNKDDLNKHIKRLLTSSKYEQIDLPAIIFSICALPNDQLICSYEQPNCLIIYDKNFMVLRTITQIGDKDMPSCRLATDNISRIYFIANGHIFMTDFDFKLIKRVGSFGKNVQQFSYISDFCYNKNHLYVCDTNNQRIQKLSSKLNFVGCFPVDIKPLQIKVSNDTACICSCSRMFSLYFFEIETFVLKHKYHCYSGRLNEINSIFYKYDCAKRNMHCYNEKGLLIGSITNEAFNEIGVRIAEIVLFNENMYLVSHGGRKLMKFSVESQINIADQVNPANQIDIVNQEDPVYPAHVVNIVERRSPPEPVNEVVAFIILFVVSVCFVLLVFLLIFL